MDHLKQSLAGLIAVVLLGYSFNSAGQENMPAADDPNYAPAPYIPDGTRNQNPQEGKLKGVIARRMQNTVMEKDDGGGGFVECATGFIMWRWCAC